MDRYSQGRNSPLQLSSFLKRTEAAKSEYHRANRFLIAPPAIEICNREVELPESSRQVGKFPVTAFYEGDRQEEISPSAGESDLVRCAIQPMSCCEALGVLSFGRFMLPS